MMMAVSVLLLAGCSLWIGGADGVDDDVAASETTFTKDGSTYQVNADGNTVTLIKYNGPITYYEIQPSVGYSGKSYKVTTIGGYRDEGGAYKGAFEGNTNLSKVDIQAYVQNVGKYAFKDCNLSDVRITGVGKTIDPSAFDGCTLERVTIICAIGEGMFKNANYLKTVNVSSVTSIGKDAFQNSSVQTINVGEGVVSIGSGAFSNCENLTDVKFTENSKVKTIDGPETDEDQGAFEGCTNLSAIRLPDSVESIGDRAFSKCTSLGTVTFASPSSGDGAALTIGEYAFSGTGITEISIPDRVTSIGAYAFSWCMDLENCELGIGSSLETIGEGAFMGCSGITSVDLPASVTSIGAYAFSGTGLTTVTVPNGTKDIGNCAFKGCTSMKEAYIGYTGESGSVGDSAFEGCTSLKEIEIGKGIGSIGTNVFKDAPVETMTIDCDIGALVFRGMGSLATVVIGDDVKEVGNSAFEDCTSLKTVTIGSGVETLSSSAFSGCMLTDTTIRCAIGDGMFQNAFYLYNVKIADGVTGIAENAFEGSTLKTISIGKDVSSIGDCAFKSCGSLKTVTFASPATLSGDGTGLTIGKYAFSGTGITEISIPDRVTSIGNGAFFGCSSLATVTFLSGSSVSAIGDLDATEGVFQNCSKLESISLPSGLTSIGAYAFSGTGFTEFVIPDSVESIGAGAFAGCSSLGSISFGTGIHTVAGNAFGKMTDPGTIEPTTFCKGDGTSRLSLASDLEEFRGRTFTGDIERMVREESYILTFDPDNGTEPWRKILKPRAMIEEPAEPEKTGHDFQYWMRADGTRFDFDTETMPAEDMTLRALWKPIVLTVTYVTGTGTDPTQDCEYGSRISLPDGESGSIVISRPGYRLTGWQDGDETYLPGDTYTVTSDVSFTAVWKAVPSPQPPWTDDEDGYVPIVTPSYDDSKDTGSDASVTAVAIAAGCAAVLALLTALVYAPKR